MTAAIDLTTLTDLKAWLGVTSSGDDTLLSALITETSMAILADLGRASIRPIIVNETRDGGDETAIVLRQWPVGAVMALSVCGRPVALAGAPSGLWSLPFTAILDSVDPAPPGGAQRLSLSCGVFPRGVQNIAVTYRAGYEIAAEGAIVPLIAPYTITAAAPYGVWASDGGVTYASGVALQAGATPGLGVYMVGGGTYTFAASDAGASVTLRYGYTPADLSRACREWAAERYAYRSRIGQSSKSLGGQETAAFIVKAMPDYVSRLLQPYRRVIGP